jgi:hypothetical protein
MPPVGLGGEGSDPVTRFPPVPRSDEVRSLLLKMALSTGLFLHAVLPPIPAVAQGIVPVRDPQTCPGCEILLELVVTLGERDGPGRVWRPSAMAVDSRENYYVAHGDGGFAATQIWVFDRDGAFTRTIGRDGEGPGEYRLISRIDVLPGDTLLVFDARLRRRTTLAPEGSVVATQSFQVGGFMNSSLLPDGRMVVNEHQSTPKGAGYPLQLVDREGRIVRPLGSVRPEYRPREPYRYQRPTSVGAAGGTAWTIGRGDYLMELWDTTGTRLAAFQREVEWFEPYVLGREVTPNGPPPLPAVGLFYADPVGLLWVAVRVPSNNWREVMLADPEWEYNWSTVEKMRDWIIEVVDAETGDLLVSQPLYDVEATLFCGGNLLVAYREDEKGYPFLDIFRLRIVPPERSPLQDGRKQE